MDFDFLSSTMVTLLKAVPMTLLLFFLSIFFGGLLALVIVAMRVSGNPILSGFAKGYIFVFRGSPLLIQMFLVFYGLAQFSIIRYSFLWPFLREPVVCAILSLALCTAGYSAEIFRGGIRAVSPKEIEAALAKGLDQKALDGISVPSDGLMGDIHASPEYRANLIAVMAKRAVAQAAG